MLPPDGELHRIRLDEIDPHPANIREDLGDGLHELADSIREVGLLQPIVVQHKADGRYEILAGHRRHAAMLLIPRLRTTMAVIRPQVSRAEALELMLVENLQRHALNPIEEAEAYQALKNLGYQQQHIAERCGVNDAHVSYRLSLLLLPVEQQRAIVARTLNITDGYRLAAELRRKKSGTRDRRPGRAKGIAWAQGRVPFFNWRHPLAPVVAERCARCGHARMVRIGPGCGDCWERIIRDDERAKALGREQAS